MYTVRGCELPEDLAYDVDRDVWVRRAGDEVVCGMTDVAQTRVSEHLEHEESRRHGG